MTGALPGLAAALLLLEALHAADLVARRPIRLVDVAWLLGILAVGAGCAAGFREPRWFVEPAAGLLLLNVLRGATGLLDPRAGLLERWRYVPVAALHLFLGETGWTVGAFLLLAARRKNLRFLLVSATKGTGPLRISFVDLDQILPEPVRYDRDGRSGTEKGFTMIEVLVSMTLLATIGAVVFTAAVQRAVRVRQGREHAVAREAAVSALERAGAVPFSELARWDGRRFSVPGDGSEGRVEVELAEPGLARIEVVAPRRGAAPVVLTTWRSEEEPR